MDGQPCGCGGYGCLQTFFGRAGVVRHARHALKLADVEVEDVTVRRVVEAALHSDVLIRGILELTGQCELGEGAGAVGAAALVLRELFAVSVSAAVMDRGAGT